MKSISSTPLASAILIVVSASTAIVIDDSAGMGASFRPLISAFGFAQPEPDAGKPFSVRVRLDARKPLHSISPLIYGASAVDPARAKVLGVSAVRWGGNRTSRYNWNTQADNAGSDWFFLNGKAGRWSDFVNGNNRAGLASYLTVPMLPWVAAGPEGWGFSVAKYGPQRKVEQYVADRGDGTRPDGSHITGNDPRIRPWPPPLISKPRASAPCLMTQRSQSSMRSTMSPCSGTRLTATCFPKGCRTKSA